MGIELYNIILPKERTDYEFEKFMTEVIFPAVHMGSTRLGQITEMRLLKDIPPNGKYIWAIYWSGLEDRIDRTVPDAVSKLRSNGVDISYLGRSRLEPEAR